MSLTWWLVVLMLFGGGFVAGTCSELFACGGCLFAIWGGLLVWLDLFDLQVASYWPDCCSCWVLWVVVGGRFWFVGLLYLLLLWFACALFVC